MRGANAFNRNDRDLTVNGANFFQLFAPIVFGMISERNSISSVITTATIISHVKNFAGCSQSTNTLVAAAPTPIAPSVCAIVFKVRIADRGRSISCLNALRDFPIEEPFCNSVLTNEGVILNSTASHIEHRNEKQIDIAAYINNVIIPQRNEVFLFHAYCSGVNIKN
jgi:hypothetical protein